MHPSLEREIPEFLFPSIVYCDNLHLNKTEKSCFVLAKNLKFYEVRKKRLINCIDLSETSLADIRPQLLAHDGGNCKWSKGADMEDQSSSGQPDSSKSVWQQSLANFEIKFGKFIQKSFDERKLYLLLHCWQKLIVVFRSTDDGGSGLRIIIQYDDVESFKVVPSGIAKYSSMLKIHFADESVICTNFEKDEDTTSTSNLLHQKGEFKQFLERVRHSKAELQFHKATTHKLIQSLKSRQTFGVNFVRSTKLDEKPMLTTCGDVWIRFTTGDDLVIGVPLVNNCAPPNLNILRNLQPVVIANLPSATSKSTNNFSYDFRVYQLQQTFENLETLATFFESENSQFENNLWTAAEAKLLPSSFVVLLMKFNLSQLMLIEEKCQLFIRFQLEKDLEMDEPKPRTFEQHLFVKSLNFEEILQRRQEYEINFEPKTLHQDFLALAMVHFETNLKIKFASTSDRSKFEGLLVSKFDFEIVHRREEGGTGFDQLTAMDLGEDDKPSEQRLPCTLFYNRKPSSLWFGALIMRCSLEDDDSDSLATRWRFYNKNEQKAFLMFKLILSDLIMIKCNVVAMKQLQECQSIDTRIVEFENALRQELATFLELSKEGSDNETRFEKMKLLMQLQYNTDLLAAAHCGDLK